MQKLDHLGWVACEWYEIDGTRFGVRTTSETFAGWIDDVLAAYRTSGPREQDDDPYWAVVIEDGSPDGGRVGRPVNILYRGIVDVVRTLDVRSVGRAFLLEVESILFPTRDDVVFLQAAALAGGGRTVLAPQVLVANLARAGRRVRRAGLLAPGARSVAIDPASGRLVPIPPALDVPADALDRLAALFPATADDARLFVDDVTPVDVVLTYGGSADEPISPASRVDTLLGLTSSITNLSAMGGRAIEALGRLVGGADCFGARWTGTEQMLATLTRVAGVGSALGRQRATAGRGR